MTLILLFVGGYFGLLAILSVSVIPYRRRLRALGGELCVLDLTPYERRFVESMMHNAYSWRAAIVLTCVYAAGLFQSEEAAEAECEMYLKEVPTLGFDPRLHQMTDAYFASVVAVSPLSGILAIIARFVFRLKIRVHHSAKHAERVTDLRAISVGV